MTVQSLKNLFQIKIIHEENNRQNLGNVQKQGSHTFSEIKFKDFSRTFQAQNYIFQALSISYLIWRNVTALFWDEVTCHIPNCNIHCVYFTYVQPVCCGTVYNSNCTMKNMDHRTNSEGDLMTKLQNPVICFKLSAQNTKKAHKKIGFLEPLFFKPMKMNFQALFKED